MFLSSQLYTRYWISGEGNFTIQVPFITLKANVSMEADRSVCTNYFLESKTTESSTELTYLHAGGGIENRYRLKTFQGQGPFRNCLYLSTV